MIWLDDYLPGSIAKARSYDPPALDCICLATAGLFQHLSDIDFGEIPILHSLFDVG
jgi:hypothetical protein